MFKGRSLAFILLVSACTEGGGGPVTVEEQDSAATGAEARNLGSAARIYRFNTNVGRCGSWSLDEDYSSGRYNAHRFAFNAEANTDTELTLARQAGSWQPALIIANTDGVRLYDGETGLTSGGVTVTRDLSGRTGAVARLKITASSRTALYAYTTSWAVIGSRYEGSITRSAEYTFAISETCAETDWQSAHRGIDLEGSHIPRAGLSNSTLRSALGVRVEPYGDVVRFDGNDFVSGTLSWFGGSNDTGVTATETGAITGERLRSLRGYFAAMRFDYSQNGRTWWGSQRLLVVNPNTGEAIVVRPVDWGPNTRTHRLIDLSQESLRALGVSTDDEVLVSFADPSTPLGPL
jgi:hypothetical protein